MTIKVFVSYSHEDERWFADGSLIPPLARYLRKDGVELWYDRKGIEAGDEFRERIEEEIAASHMAILLVSQGFLTSYFIQAIELPLIREKAVRDEMVVVPILLEPCEWEDLDFVSSRQMMPGKPTPLIDYTESERDWAHVRFEILKGIKSRVRKLAAAERSPATEPDSRTDAEAQDRSSGTVRTTTLTDEDTADTRASLAWMVGNRIAKMVAAWDEAHRDPVARAGLRRYLVEMDRYLQWLALPFLLASSSPTDAAGLLAAARQSAESLESELQHALHLGLYMTLWADGSLKLRRANTQGRTDPTAQIQAYHGLAVQAARSLELPARVVDEVASAGPTTDHSVLGLMERVMAELKTRPGQATGRTAVTQDRTGAWIEERLAPSPGPDTTPPRRDRETQGHTITRDEAKPRRPVGDTEESIAWLAGGRGAHARLAWERAAQGDLCARVSLNRYVLEMDRLLKRIGVEVPLPDGPADTAEDLLDAAALAVEVAAADIGEVFSAGLNYVLCARALLSAFRSEEADRRDALLQEARMYHERVQASASAAGIDVDLERRLSLLLPAAIPSEDIRAVAAFEAVAVELAEAILAQLRASGNNVYSPAQLTRDRTTPWLLACHGS